MVASAGLLVVLDAAILSATPDLTRIAVALVVTLVVGGSILAIWRSNLRLERAAADAEKKSAKGGKKPVAGGRPGAKKASAKQEGP
jgi:hypothetical protein